MTTQRFDDIRKYINHYFKVSANGKFVGISTLRSMFGDKWLERIYADAYCTAKDVTIIRIYGQGIVKLYSF